MIATFCCKHYSRSLTLCGTSCPVSGQVYSRLLHCSKTLVAGASLYVDTDAKFGGPLHIEALPDQQQVLLVLSGVILCCAVLRCAVPYCAVLCGAVHVVHIKTCSTTTASAEGSGTYHAYHWNKHVCHFDGRAVSIAGSCCSSDTTPLCSVRCRLPPLALSN